MKETEKEILLKALCMYLAEEKRDQLEAESINPDKLKEKDFMEKLYSYMDETKEGLDNFTRIFQGWDWSLREFPDYVFSGLTKKEYCSGDRSMLGKLDYEIKLADSITGEKFCFLIKDILKSMETVQRDSPLFSCERKTRENLVSGFTITEDGKFQITESSVDNTFLFTRKTTGYYTSRYPYPSLLQLLRNYEDRIIEALKSVEDDDICSENSESLEEKIGFKGREIKGNCIFGTGEKQSEAGSFLNAICFRIFRTLEEYRAAEEMEEGLQDEEAC